MRGGIDDAAGDAPGPGEPDGGPPAPPGPTEHLRRVLVAAEHEARRAGAPSVDSGHLLLAMLKTGSGAGVRAIEDLGVETAALREGLTRTAAEGGPPARGGLPLSAPAERALDLAREEARALDHTYLGTEHLLLGILRQGEGPGYEALAAAGVGLPAARAQVRRLLEEALPRSARRYPAPGGALDREILECIADLATDHAKRWFPEKVVEIEARHEAGLPGTPYGIMIRWIEGRRARRALVLWAPDTTSLRRSIPRLIALLAAEMDGE